jgi:site-specific recombinase XerD
LHNIKREWNLIREAAVLPGLRIHDLRHSFASAAVAGGESLFLVGKVLGHKQSRTTERYAHVHDRPLRQVPDRTSGALAAAMANGRGKAKVVPLPKTKGAEE